MVLEAIAAVAVGSGSFRAVYDWPSCFNWLKMAWYFGSKGKNPVKSLPHALLEHFPGHSVVKMRLFGIAGPQVFFLADEALVAHVTSSPRYRRVNPLDSRNFSFAEVLTKITGMKSFLQTFLDQSIWFQPYGDVHRRQRELFLSFVPKFLTQDKQAEVHELSRKLLEERIRENGRGADLFDLLQEVVSILQLHFISDYQLMPSMTVREYCDVTNSAFGGMYSFQSPSPEQVQKLSALCKHMLKHGGSEGLVQHMRDHASKDLSATQREVELLHNLMAGLFLGQQSLANGAYWVVLRLAQEPETLALLREDLRLLPQLIAEELRLHPPSSPFLMPYKALEDDEFGGFKVPAGSIVAMMPILLHLNEDHWPEAKDFNKARFYETILDKRNEYQGHRPCSWSSGPAPLAEVNAAMVQGNRTCPISGNVGSQKYCPFGVGKDATCPMQGFSISVLLNLLAIIIPEWDVEVHDLSEPSFSACPVTEHVNVDTGSRPWKRVKATFRRRS
mmetsp:Transcript_54952/g.67347  ORF Transcript_54952/g.67347 Transcript_54952/m.67347 type:complete len:503 (-) Transcript_54952:388-1896(-)